MKTKILVVVLVVIMAMLFWVWRNKYSQNQNDTITFVRIDSDAESSQHIPLLPKNWMSEIEKKWANKDWEMWKNPHYDICKKICNDVYSKNKYWEKNQSHADFLNELTKEQRIYFTLINFESQVNNGGVYQFLSNNPELSILALEGMQETKMEKLSTDYELVLTEYFGKFETIQDLYLKFQNNKSNWKNRYTAFEEGYKELTSAEKIEDYFYEESFIKTYHQNLTNYVKDNPNKFYRTE